jgi:hypothetical protein
LNGPNFVKRKVGPIKNVDFDEFNKIGIHEFSKRNHWDCKCEGIIVLKFKVWPDQTFEYES